MGSGNEIVVPQSFVEKLGLKDKEALGKTVTFQGSIFNWNSGDPVSMPVTSQCKNSRRHGYDSKIRCGGRINRIFG
mgnify:CR=1 FL=1